MIRDRLPKNDSFYTQDVMEILLYHEMARVQRYTVPLTLLRLRVVCPQGAKLQVADGVVKIVAHILKANLRLVDMIGRYEKDYLAILPITDETGAMNVSQRLTKFLYNTHPYRYGKTLETTPFIGLATLAPNITLSMEGFLTQATEALAEAYRRAPGTIMTYREVEKLNLESQP
jgi:diguanylate cyclase (GGDEF)-like protein